MKLLRYGPKGSEKPGILDKHGRIRDLFGVIADISPQVLANDLDRLAALDLETLPEVSADVRIGVPILGVGKIVCIGLNYRKHAEETGAAVPPEPLVFMKATTSLSGPYDPVILPKGATKGDWEVEYAIIIGKTARYVSEADAMDHVAGYCVLNDVSERAFQMERVGQWTKGKSCDTFAPLGPWLVTKDEIRDPHKLALWLEVNGHRYQDSNTSDNIFSVTNMVSYLSQFMTLEPGDVISTGTPEGTGVGQKPPVFLKPGDVMRLGVEGLGEQRQDVVAYNGAG
ncbi:MAG: fumarylacetoacetate hydrolase family protein [Gammaproteobacteria bacterium]|nr:fumarylacetoacetate hydrolase family protein [Gammaproteobacteria bacterium]